MTRTPKADAQAALDRLREILDAPEPMTPVHLVTARALAAHVATCVEAIQEARRFRTPRATRPETPAP